MPVLPKKQRSWLEPLRIGEPVILNNVLSQRFLGGFARSMDGLLKNS